MTAAAVVASSLSFAGAAQADPTEPDFGPNVTIFDPSTPVDQINTTLESFSNEGEFSTNRHAVFFKPGTYGSAAGQDHPETAEGIVNAEVGYYTSIAGLGASPDDVLINGALHVEAVQSNPDQPWNSQSPGSLNRFWRSLSNVAINPIQRPVGEDATRAIPEGVAAPHQLRWAVSQASPLRRVDVKGDLSLFGRFGAYASGGYLANSNVDGTVANGSQQQWFTRNSSVGHWDGAVWNAVFSGVTNAPPQTFPNLPITTVDETPINRESPFLYLDGADYKVFVPKAESNSSGVNWNTDASAGDSISIDDFFIAKPSNSAAQINAQLAAGKNLILTPGVYSLDQSLKVTRADTVVLGLGLATVVPTSGTAAIEVADVSGVKIAAVTVDAGPVNSNVLIKVGPTDAAVSDAGNPTTLTDVYVRIGGYGPAKATTAIEINSDNVLLDHIWSWRADHGEDVSWTSNTSDHGLIVNGDNVTALGLFVEHYQKNQVIWNGNGGETIFYQSELPYDPPSQADWSDGTRNGYASYRVSDNVTTHSAYGLGVYSFFNQDVPILAENGIQAPLSRRVTFESATSVFLNGRGGISHVINDSGSASIGAGASPATLVSYPPADTQPPVAAISTSPASPDGSGDWYKTAVTLTATGTDNFSPAPTVEANVDGAGWQSVSAPFTIADGNHTVVARATDDSGLQSAEVQWTGKVDTIAPEAVPTVDAASGTISVTATDAGSGLATLEYSLGSAPATGSSEWKPYAERVTVTPGSRVLSYRASDVAGNVSAIGSATLANPNAPALTISGSLTAGQRAELSGTNIPSGAYSVVLRSDPVTVATATVGDAGTVAVGFVIPAATPGGAHHLELVNQAGVVIAALDVTIVAAGPGTSSGPGAGAGALASTGSAALPLGGLAALVLLAGTALFVGRRLKARS